MPLDFLPLSSESNPFVLVFGFSLEDLELDTVSCASIEEPDINSFRHSIHSI
ncbi:hypothetical protein GXM_10244 [Nostoc sphaeroides CCNUC1]|uniref:Uncharacterized protein n=1 Tax=Nostoc sphaeroides CCNUC1 TaxID=2653204 RepID=A0A5P8WK87_9NOSO|nr:hypothetical protein GXM_10244 [Nostoc sphaeroides CCNUC1]